MTASKSFMNDQEKVQKVLDLYCRNPDKPTVQQVAEMMETRWHNVNGVIRTHLTLEERKNEKALRYSRSKMHERNPMKGKNGSLHHNYQGVIQDGHGYLQVKIGSRYILLHRHVMAQALGLEKLPSWLEVHHIDEDPYNNDIDNLALVTSSGHGKLHFKRSRLERLPLWAQWEYGILKLREITPTLPMDS